MKRKPRTRKRKAKPKTTPAIHITINVVVKKKDENSKATRRLIDKYISERQGIKFVTYE